jgi:hypothetical protein
VTETKKFHIGDVLSITSGVLVSPRHIEGVYDICDWMTGEKNMTHQLPRVSREITPDLRRQHPALAAVTVPSGMHGKDEVFEWLATLYPVHGEYVDVARLSDPEDHTTIDPIAEIKMMRPDVTIIAVGREGA